MWEKAPQQGTSFAQDDQATNDVLVPVRSNRYTGGNRSFFMFSPEAIRKPAEPTKAFGTVVPQILNNPPAAVEDIGTADTMEFPQFQPGGVRPEALAKVPQEDLDRIIADSLKREGEIRAREGVTAYWDKQQFLWELGAEQVVERAHAIDAHLTSLIASRAGEEKARRWENTLVDAGSSSAFQVCSRRKGYIYGSDGTPFEIDPKTDELRPSTDRSKKPVVAWFADPKMKEEIEKTAGDRYTEEEVRDFFFTKLRDERLMDGRTLNKHEEEALTYEAEELALNFRTRKFAARLESGGYLGTPVMAEKIGTIPFEGPTRAFAVNRLLIAFRLLGAFPNFFMGFGALTEGEGGDTIFSIRPQKEEWKPITDSIIVQLGINHPSEWGGIFVKAGLVTFEPATEEEEGEKTQERKEEIEKGKQKKVAECVATFQKGLTEAATFSALVGTMSKGSLRVEQNTGKVFLDNTPDALSLATDLPCLEKKSGAQTALYSNDLDTLGRMGSVAFEVADHAKLQIDPGSAVRLKQACEKIRQPGSPHGALVQDLFSLVHGDETIAALEVKRLLRLATLAADENETSSLRETHKTFVSHLPNTPILLQLLKQQGGA